MAASEIGKWQKWYFKQFRTQVQVIGLLSAFFLMTMWLCNEKVYENSSLGSVGEEKKTSVHFVCSLCDQTFLFQNNEKSL